VEHVSDAIWSDCTDLLCLAFDQFWYQKRSGVSITREICHAQKEREREEGQREGGGDGVEDAAAVAIAAQTAQDQAHHDVIISEASSVRVAIGDVESSINSAADRSVAATNTVKGAIVAVRGAVESTSATEVAAMLDVNRSGDR
jgi:hypothetical protein